MSQSSFAGFLCIAQESLATYGEDAIDLANNPAADLVFLRPYAFDVSWAAAAEPMDVVRPSFSRHQHANVPTHIDIGAWNTPIIASPAPGTAGGEAPVGVLEAFVAAGFTPTIDTPGEPLFLRPSTPVTESFTAYRWKRHIKGGTQAWRLWRLHGCRLTSFSFGGAVNKVATVEASGASANFEKDKTETAQPWGETKALEWFDEANRVKLDQYGDALAFTGTFQHAIYTPMVTTVARVTVAGQNFSLSQWRIVVSNTIDTKPVQLSSGAVIQQTTISDREIRLEGTLKDTEAAYDAIIESVRENLNGDPEAVILGVHIIMDDGTGSGGTTWEITGTLQFDVPSRGDENKLAAWSIAGIFTPHTTTRAFTGVELTFSNTAATIVRTTGSWINDGVTVGETITPSGTVSNNVEFTITDVTADTLKVSAAPTDESAVTCNYDIGPTLLGDNELQVKIYQTP